MQIKRTVATCGDILYNVMIEGNDKPVLQAVIDGLTRELIVCVPAEQSRITDRYVNKLIAKAKRRDGAAKVSYETGKYIDIVRGEAHIIPRPEVIS